MDEVIRITLLVKNPQLKKSYEINKKTNFNGLVKYSCECAVYTPNSQFYIAPPQFSREESYQYWDVGFLDIRNMIFYELGQLINMKFEKNLFFFEWTAFLQIIIDQKIYSNLFNTLAFEKGILSFNDRQHYEPTFFKQIRNILPENFSVDFIIYICDLFKNNKRLVSYSILKSKLSSNLKNFKEFKKTSTSNFY